MKQKTALVLAVAAALAVSSTAPAQSFQKFYKAMLPKVAKAMETGDVKFFDQMTTPDFTEKTPQGILTKAASIARMKQEFSMVKKMTCQIKPVSMKPSGSKATATAWMKASMTLKSPDGKLHTISMEQTETENWVKVGSTWKVRTIVEGQPQHVMMDGKALPTAGG